MANENDLLQNIADLRREYTRGGLRRKDLPEHPMALFGQWLNQRSEERRGRERV